MPSQWMDLGKMPGFAPERPKDGFDIIPMWIADMNFPTAPPILDAMMNRIQHPSFGYFMTSDAYTNAIIDWQEEKSCGRTYCRVRLA